MNDKLTPTVALVALSGLAADFKMGIVPEDEVIRMIEVIAGAMTVPDREDTIRQALEPWWIER